MTAVDDYAVHRTSPPPELTGPLPSSKSDNNLAGRPPNRRPPRRRRAGDKRPESDAPASPDAGAGPPGKGRPAAGGNGGAHVDCYI
jgi:hypothetical protein